MNSRQRIMATVAGEPTDRPAFTATLSLYGAALTGCPLQQYYTSAAAYADGQAAVAETFAPDILFTPFSCPAEGEAFGTEVAFFDHQPPNVVRPAISSVDEIASLVAPDVDAHPRLTYIREALRTMVSAHGKERAVAAITLSPVGVPLMIMGISGWIETVLFDPQGARRMLDVTRPFSVRWANTLLGDGADFVAMPMAMFSPSVVTRKIAETFTRPALAETFGEIDGPIILHHAGGPCMKHLDLFVGLPNVVGVVIDNRDDPVEARGILGPEMLLLSGPNGPELPERTADQIHTECRDRLARRNGDRKAILATAAADIPLATPAENIHAICRAVGSDATEGL